MKPQLIIISLTIFFIVNTYYDGKYLDMIKNGKKYYLMAMYAFVGLSAYLFIQKHPNDSKSMVKYANSMIKHMPLEKESIDVLSPIFDFTMQPQSSPHDYHVKRIQTSGTAPTQKRAVSETKKKYVAANQKWCCSACGEQLQAWFEVDHITALQHGGTNHVDNLTAVCRNCHGRKTAMTHL
jgi:hypothetical protein